MSIFLAGFAAQLAPGTRAVLVLDQAGWHLAGDLAVPAHLARAHLPPTSPDLNPCMDDPRSARALSAIGVLGPGAHVYPASARPDGRRP